MTEPGLESGCPKSQISILSNYTNHIGTWNEDFLNPTASQREVYTKTMVFLQAVSFQICVYILHYKCDFAVSFLIMLRTWNNLSTHLIYSSLPWVHQAASALLASLASHHCDFSPISWSMANGASWPMCEDFKGPDFTDLVFHLPGSTK